MTTETLLRMMPRIMQTVSHQNDMVESAKKPEMIEIMLSGGGTVVASESKPITRSISSSSTSSTTSNVSDTEDTRQSMMFSGGGQAASSPPYHMFFCPPHYYHHQNSIINSQSLVVTTPSSPLSPSSATIITSPSIQVGSSSSQQQLVSNSNDELSPSSPSISSPLSAAIASPLANLNTSTLVRTISNGSTFGPIPHWPLCLQQSPQQSTTSAIPTSPSIDSPIMPTSANLTTTTTTTSPQPPSNNKPQFLLNSVIGNQSVTNQNSINNSNNLINVNGGNGTCSSSILATTSPVLPNMVKLQLPLVLGDRYILTSQLEASNLYQCLDLPTMEEFCCKVVLSKNYYDFLAPHLLMDGHPGVNQVQKIIVGRTHTFILFEAQSGDLHSYVRAKRRLKESEAMPLFQQIVQIVADCHVNGIVLRDLKLRKFIFSNKEKTQLKLETLEGASLFDNDDDTLTDKHGCPAYVSPEILYSNSFSGMAADCWSLGVILYTMLIGRYPFHDVNPSVVFCKIRRGTYYIPDSVSRHAKCLIRSLIRIDPTQRLSAEDALSHRWFQTATNNATITSTVSPNSTLTSIINANISLRSNTGGNGRSNSHYHNQHHSHHNHHHHYYHHHHHPTNHQQQQQNLSNFSISTNSSSSSNSSRYTSKPATFCCNQNNCNSTKFLDQLVPDLNIDVD